MKKKFLCVLMLIAVLSASVIGAEGLKFGASAYQFTMPSGVYTSQPMQCVIALGVRSKAIDFDLGFSNSTVKYGYNEATAECLTGMLRLGSKINISKTDDFTFGLNYFTQSDGGSDVKFSESTALGFYLGLQHSFTDHLVLEFQCFPVMWSQNKYETILLRNDQYVIGTAENSATDIGAIGIGLSYLF